jgi:sugar phosphate isomerase/epimerase
VERISAVFELNVNLDLSPLLLYRHRLPIYSLAVYDLGGIKTLAVQRVGISLRHEDVADPMTLAGDLEVLHEIGPDFVEVCPQGLGVIVGGQLDWERMGAAKEVLAAADLEYTVHPPLRLNLMDLDRLELQRGILESGVRFAGEIGAPVVVCHAGVRDNRRHARHSLMAQLATERAVLRDVGDLAGELGVTIAVENWCPIQPLIDGEHYTYSVWPSELTGQVAAVDHPSVGICLDVGHAFVASRFHGFDFVKECAVAAPLVSHLHLHDNLGRPQAMGEPEPTERLAYGLGDLHLPPGKGEIPLEELFSQVEFTRADTCCVELPSGTDRNVAKEALDAARELAGLTKQNKKEARV